MGINLFFRSEYRDSDPFCITGKVKISSRRDIPNPLSLGTTHYWSVSIKK